MKNTYLILFCLLFAQINIAQTPDYDLADFKLPDFNFQSLYTEVTFDLKNQETTSRLSGNQVKINNGEFFGQVILNYYGIKNDSVYQNEHSIGTSISSFFQDSQRDDNDNYSKAFTFSANLHINNSKRNYYKGNHFIEFSPTIGFNSSNRKDTNIPASGNETIDKSKSSGFLLIPTIKFGKGRIEQVTDARNAIYILDALKTKGRLQRTLNKDEILELAEEIVKIRRTRIIDFRLRKIYQLEAIDSFLQSKNYIEKTDMKYFTTLNDQWTYGNFPLRFSGVRSSFAFYPGYQNLVNFNNNGFGEQEIITNSLFANIGYEIKIEKPLNLFFQNTFDAYSSIGIIHRELEDKVNDFDANVLIPKLSIGAENTLGFYPNTRTSLSFSNLLQMSWIQDFISESEDATRVRGFGTNARSNLNITYFLSPQFSVSANSTFLINFFEQYNEVNGEIFNNLEPILDQPNCPNLNCFNYFSDRKSVYYAFNLQLNYSIF